MLRGGRERTIVLALSILGHGVVLGLLAATRGMAPGLMTPSPVIEVQIVPAYVPVAPPRPAPKRAAPSSPAPNTFSPRLSRRPADEAPIAPLMAPQSPAAAPALEPGVRAALRGGALGCANPDALGLDSQARARCLERLGAGARETAFIPAPLSKQKQADFDSAAARKEADRQYREAQIPPGLSTSDAPGGITGLGQTRRGQSAHDAAPFP